MGKLVFKKKTVRLNFNKSMIASLVVSIVILVIMLIVIPTYMVKMHPRTDMKEEICRVFIYAISFTAITCFICLNQDLIVKFVDFAVFFISPFIFLIIGWLLCTYVHSFFTLLFMTLHLSASIISIIHKAHISFSIICLTLFVAHIIQFSLEFKVSRTLYEGRSMGNMAFSALIIVLTVFFNMLVPLAEEYLLSVVIISYIVLLLAFLIGLVICAIWRKDQFTNLFLILEVIAMIVYSRVISYVIGIIEFIIYFAILFANDLCFSISEEEMFEYKRNLYEKVGIRKVQLIKQGEKKKEIIGTVYQGKKKFKVTCFSLDCLSEYSFSEIIFGKDLDISHFDILDPVESVQKIVIKSNILLNINEMLKFFPNCKKIDVSNDNKFITAENGVIYKRSSFSIFYVNKDINKLFVRRSIKSIEDYACRNCYLNRVSFNDSLVRIGNYSFDSCSSLTSISFPENLEIIDNCAFKHCTALKFVSFTKCKKLRSIESYAFSDTIISEITLPSCLTKLGIYVFSDCRYLKKISFQEGSERVTFDGILSNMILFKAKIFIPNSWKAITSDFYGNASFYEIVFPKLEKWKIETIEERAFKHFYLKSFTIPKSVMQIEKEAFACSKNLEVIKFESGSQLRYCDPSAFDECPKLKEFEFTDENISKVFDLCRNDIDEFEII